jgi:hypothetical protein
MIATAAEAVCTVLWFPFSVCLCWLSFPVMLALTSGGEGTAMQAWRMPSPASLSMWLV